MKIIKIGDNNGTTILGEKRTGVWAVQFSKYNWLLNTDGSIMTFAKKKYAQSAVDSLKK